jgi:hypothetical protein
VKIDAQLLKELIFGDYEGGAWQVVQDEMTGTWRWGVEHRIILRRVGAETLTLWGYDYRVGTSNEEYNLQFIEDGDSEVELWKAVAVPVHAIEYREDKSGS